MNTKQTLEQRNEEAHRLAEFGMFGCDFLETKRIVNKLLKRHGLKLRTHGSVRWSTDQVEVWIEEMRTPENISRV